MEEIALVIPLIVAAALGSIIGLERSLNHKPAGVRTHALVCMGAALITVVATSVTSSDPTASARVIAGIITGVGFLGAGAIMHLKENVEGLTTAAGIWVVAAIGIATGMEYYLFATVAALLTLLILEVERITKKRRL